MVLGMTTHGCRRDSKTDTVGGGKDGSANAPTGTHTSESVAVELKTLTPHSGQK